MDQRESISAKYEAIIGSVVSVVIQLTTFLSIEMFALIGPLLIKLSQSNDMMPEIHSCTEPNTECVTVAYTI